MKLCKREIKAKTVVERKFLIKRPLTKRVSIYVLKDPRCGKVRYVGKTKCSFQKRLREHLCCKANNHRCCWIQSLIKLNLKPVMEEIEKCTDYDWQEREIYWIKHYKELGFDLTNSVDGGLGSHNPSEETKAKISAAKKGKVFSAEHKAKLSIARKKRITSPETRAKLSISSKNISPETRAKMSESQKGRKHSLESRAKMRAVRAAKIFGGSVNDYLY